MTNKNCIHCCGTEYVLERWLEKVLEQNGIHMTEIPPEAFKKIPIELLYNCHCNVRLAFFPRNEIVRCLECEGTTWRFTEIAEQADYRWKKVSNLSPDEIKTLPCEFFERCPCSLDEQAPKPPEKKKALSELFDLLKIKIPNLSFGLRSFCSY